MKRIAGLIVPGMIAGAVLIFAVVRPRMRHTPPNILLVMVCSLRYDHLGFSGYERKTSPHIDAFAATASRYVGCYTHIPATLQSVFSFLLGRYPEPLVQGPEEVSLTRRLQQRGYRTYGVMGTNMVHGLGDKYGVDIALQVLDGPDNMPTGQDAHTVPAERVVSRAIEILQAEQARNAPMFLWVFLKDPHWKYLPPVKYADRFVTDQVYRSDRETVPVDGAGKSPIDSMHHIGEARLPRKAGGYITERAHYVAQYDAEIAYADEQFGRLIASLQNEGSFDEWLVIFVSDHGEYLGEEGYYFDHGYKIGAAGTRIPLLIKHPRQRQSSLEDGLIAMSDLYALIERIVSGEKQAAEISARKNAIFLENASFLEPEGEKMIGCVWADKRIEQNVTSGTIRLYRETRSGSVLCGEGQEQRDDVAEGMRKLEDFFTRRKSHELDAERLKSLGYL